MPQEVIDVHALGGQERGVREVARREPELLVRGKMKRMGRGYAKTQNWKKAIVTLRDGDKIAAFEAS